MNKVVLDKVILDWNNQFPSLQRYMRGQKLLKRFGPIVIGIELEKFSSDEYRPRFIAINLLSNPKKLIRCIYQSAKNKKGLDVIVPYSKHSVSYIEACSLIQSQSRISLRMEPSIYDIINGIKDHIDNDLSEANPFFECEALMYLSKYLPNPKTSNEVFQNALDRLNRVPRIFIETYSGGYETWVNRINSYTIEELNNCIKESIMVNKLQNISGIDL